jgi:translation elongation factor EF-4
LTLNDASVNVQKETRYVYIELNGLLLNVYYSLALGQGWRLGFLGTLHLDVFRQRLEKVMCLM